MPEPCPSNPDCPQCHGDGVYGGIDSRPCYCTTCLPLPLQAKEYEIDFKEFDGLSRMILVPRLAIRGDWRNAKGRCVHWLGHLLRIVGVKPIANSTFEFGEPDEVRRKYETARQHPGRSRRLAVRAPPERPVRSAGPVHEVRSVQFCRVRRVCCR